MQNLKIVDKIQKLLRLGENNSNEHEAESAILHAQRLMAKHGISMGEIQVEDDEKNQEIKDINLTNYRKLEFWHIQLASIIAENFKCVYYLSPSGNAKKSLKFVGLTEDLEIAKTVYFFALETIEYFKTLDMIKFKRINRDKKYGKGDENDYIKGFLRGLQEKLQEQRAKEEFALVLVTPQEVEDYIDNLGLVSKKARKVSSAGNSEAYNKGFSRGKDFEHGRTSIAE